MMPTPRFVAVLVLALLALSAPATAREKLTIGMTQYPATMHPGIDPMLAKTYVLGFTRRDLTIHGPDWKLRCQLCTSLPTLENGGAKRVSLPDGKEGVAVTFTIHPQAKWGDGVPVTAKDVVFGWEVGKHPESGYATSEGFRRVLKIDVIDDKTVTFTVDRLTFQYNAFSDFPILPEHLERKAFEADPARYKLTTLYDTQSTNPGLWNGPYLVTELTQGSHVVLGRNPHWYGARPAFDQIVVRVVENTAALEANLLSGAIDMIAGELGLSLEQAVALEKRQGDRFRFEYQPSLFYEHMEPNLADPIVGDVRVRRAILHGIDREAISKQLFGGKQPVAHSNVNPLDGVYSPEVPKHPFDVEKAKALLEEAGWKPGPGGIRVNAKGEPLRIELMTTAGNRSRELVQQVMRDQLRKVGIDLRLRNEPARIFFGETVRKRKFPQLTMFAWLSSPESVPRTTLHSEEISTEANGWGGQNYTGYANPEMDKLLDAIERELDPEKRKVMWRRLQEMYATELPALPLFFRSEPHVLPKWLGGIKPTGHKYPTSYWVEEWTTTTN